MIKAKSVSNKFWILKGSNGKIGEVNSNNGEYILTMKGVRTSFTSLSTLTKKTGIEFSNTIGNTNTTNDDNIYGFPFTGKKFNEMWDLKLKLPLFTKRDDSKSWFVAGYFKVKIKGKWRDILAPKLLILQRNEYKGPYKSLDNGESSHQVNTVKTTFTKSTPLRKWFS